MKLKYFLSPFHQLVLPKEILNSTKLVEAVNCNRCEMAQHRLPKGTRKYYLEDLKCCTFEPILPNFSVGEIVSNRKVASESFQNVLFDGIVLPIGIAPHKKYQFNFIFKKKLDFGKREDLLCRFYDRDLNRCGVWKNRGAVCTTFYCKSIAGPKGLQFWESLGDFLFACEMAAAEEILVDFGFSPRCISDQLAFLKMNFDKGAKVDAEKQWILTAAEKKEIRAFWKVVPDLTPVQFYLQCQKKSRAMNRAFVLESLGEMGDRLQNSILKKFEHFREI